jgi:hypothetical protein
MYIDRGCIRIFFICPSFLKFQMKFSQRYIADTNGVACNSRLLQTNASKGYPVPVTDYLLQQHHKLFGACLDGTTLCTSPQGT